MRPLRADKVMRALIGGVSSLIKETTENWLASLQSENTPRRLYVNQGVDLCQILNLPHLDFELLCLQGCEK